MKSYEYETLRRHEDEYWWYQGLHRILLAELSGKLDGSPRILDAGCGTGGNLAAVKKAFPDALLTGVDASPEAVLRARDRHVAEIFESRIERMPFGNASFDAVLSMDVLYMAGVDEATAMKECARVLKPKGIFAVNLAAFDFLKGQHDMAVKTERRYTKKSVRGLLATAGFDVIRIFYWNNLMFFPLLLWRPVSRAMSDPETPRSDIRELPGLMNGILRHYLCAETALSRACALPFGVSVFAVGRRS